MITKKITIGGMSCGHCKKAIEDAVGSLAGITEAQVNLDAKCLTVTFDENKSSLESIKEAITEEGFTVE